MPAANPVTTPVPDPTVAVNGVPLVHIPPGVASLSVIVCVAHTVFGPDTGTGVGFTVMSLGCIQPAPTVYTIVATPVFRPVIMPPGPAVAISGERLLHVPPGTRFVYTVL